MPFSPGIWLTTAVAAIAGLFFGGFGIGGLIVGALAGLGIGGLAQAFMPQSENPDDPEQGNFFTRLFTPAKAKENSPSAETAVDPNTPEQEQRRSIPSIVNSDEMSTTEKAGAISSTLYNDAVDALKGEQKDGTMPPPLTGPQTDPGSPDRGSSTAADISFWGPTAFMAAKVLGAGYNVAAKTTNMGINRVVRGYTRLTGQAPIDVNPLPEVYAKDMSGVGSFRTGFRRIFSLDYLLPKQGQGTSGWFEWLNPKPANQVIANRSKAILDECVKEGRLPTPREMNYLDAAKNNPEALQRMGPEYIERLNQQLEQVKQAAAQQAAETPTQPTETTTPQEPVVERVGRALEAEGFNLGEHAAQIKADIAKTIKDLAESTDPVKRAMAERLKNGLEAESGTPERTFAEEVVRRTGKHYADNFDATSGNQKPSYLTEELIRQEIRGRLSQSGVEGTQLEHGVKTLEYFSQQPEGSAQRAFYENVAKGERAANQKAAAELKSYDPTNTELGKDYLSNRMLSQDAPPTTEQAAPEKGAKPTEQAAKPSTEQAAPENGAKPTEQTAKPTTEQAAPENGAKPTEQAAPETAPENTVKPTEQTAKPTTTETPPPVKAPTPFEVLTQRIGVTLNTEGLNLGENAGQIQTDISKTINDLMESSDPIKKAMAERVKAGLEAEPGTQQHRLAEEVVRRTGQRYAENFDAASSGKNTSFLTQEMVTQDIRARLSQSGVEGVRLEHGMETLEHFRKCDVNTPERAFYENVAKGEPTATAKAVAELQAYDPANTGLGEGYLSGKLLSQEVPPAVETPNGKPAQRPGTQAQQDLQAQQLQEQLARQQNAPKPTEQATAEPTTEQQQQQQQQQQRQQIPDENVRRAQRAQQENATRAPTEKAPITEPKVQAEVVPVETTAPKTTAPVEAPVVEPTAPKVTAPVEVPVVEPAAPKITAPKTAAPVETPVVEPTAPKVTAPVEVPVVDPLAPKSTASVKGTPTTGVKAPVAPRGVLSTVNANGVSVGMNGLAVYGGLALMANDDMPALVRYTAGPGLASTGGYGLATELASLRYARLAANTSTETLAGMESAASLNAASQRLSGISHKAGRACLYVAAPLEGFMVYDSLQRGDNYGAGVHGVNAGMTSAMIVFPPSAVVALPVLLANTALDIKWSAFGYGYDASFHDMAREVLATAESNRAFHRLLDTPGIQHTGRVSELYINAMKANDGLPVYKQAFPEMDQYPHITRAENHMAPKNSYGFPYLNPMEMKTLSPNALRARLDMAIKQIEDYMETWPKEMRDLDTPDEVYWANINNEIPYLGNALGIRDYQGIRDNIATAEQYHSLYRTLKAARYELTGELSGDDKGMILIRDEDDKVIGRLPSYSLRYTEIISAQGKYFAERDKIAPTLEPYIEPATARNAARKEAIEVFAERTKSLQSYASQYLEFSVPVASTKEAEELYAHTKRVYEVDKRDVLAQYQMLEAEWKMYEAQGAALMEAYTQIGAKAFEQRQRNAAVFQNEETKKFFEQHPELLKDATLKASESDYQDFVFAYQMSKQASEKAQLALAEFGSAEDQQKLLASRDETYMKALHASQKAEHDLLQSYVALTGAESAYADRYEYLSGGVNLNIVALEDPTETLTRMAERVYPNGFERSNPIFGYQAQINTNTINELVSSSISSNPLVDFERGVRIACNGSTYQTQLLLDELQKCGISASVGTEDGKKYLYMDKGTLEAFLRCSPHAHKVEDREGTYLISLPSGTNIKIGNTIELMYIGNRPAVPVMQNGHAELVQAPWGRTGWKEQYQTAMDEIPMRKHKLEERYKPIDCRRHHQPQNEFIGPDLSSFGSLRGSDDLLGALNTRPNNPTLDLAIQRMFGENQTGTPGIEDIEATRAQTLAQTYKYTPGAPVKLGAEPPKTAEQEPAMREELQYLQEWIKNMKNSETPSSTSPSVVPTTSGVPFGTKMTPGYGHEVY